MIAVIALTILQLLPPAGQANPYRSPQLASSTKLVALAFGSGKAIYVATSTDQGQHFSEPIRVAEADILPLSRHRGPHIAISKNIIVVTAVTGREEAKGPHSHGLPSDGDLYAWRSADGGKSWSKPVRVNDATASAREGLHSLAADGRGNVFAVWLDQRTDHVQLYGAISRDSGATWSANRLLYKSPDGDICQCCHPTASYSPHGALEVMWRNCMGGARDFYLIRSTDGKRFSEPQKLGTGTWKINACPMDGGGLTHEGNRTLTAWRREVNIYLAEPGKPETKLGEGKDVAIAASQGQVYVLWIENGQLQLWKNGKVEPLAEKASYPAIVSLPQGGVLIAWEENGGIRIEQPPKSMR